jgi:Fur family ferric uptake transcriptional regulator
MVEPSMLISARERIRATGERLTAPRERVLAALLGGANAQSHQDIEHALGRVRVDRVTLYRVLEWLVEKRLAHRIAGSDRVWRFGIAGETHASHAHFECSRCGKVQCLDEVSARKIALQVPPGCRPERMELTVTGLCAECP